MAITVKPATPKDVVTASLTNPNLAAQTSKKDLRQFGSSTASILNQIYGNPDLIKANANQQSLYSFDDFEVKTISGYEPDRNDHGKTPSPYKFAPVVAYPEDEDEHTNTNVISMTRRSP